MSANTMQNTSTKTPKTTGKVSTQSRNANIALFALAFLIMATAMIAVFSSIARQVSLDFAGRFATSSANALSSHIEKEIGLLAKAARSDAVTLWLANEGDAEKKRMAFEEMSGIIRELYSQNLYIGVQSSLNEYNVSADFDEDDIRPVATLDRDNPDDAWYFACIESDREYLADIGIDHLLNRKRMWLDYKVERDGVPLGVLCTGLEFSQIARELFAHSDTILLRGIIIDENGMVLMDSSLLDDQGFMYDDVLLHIGSEFSDPAFLTALGLTGRQFSGYTEMPNVPTIIAPGTGSFRYVTITPIRSTAWSAVVVYDSTAMFGMSRFLPAFVVILLLLVVFAFATNIISNRLIFAPMDQLIASLARLKEDNEEEIYGISRNDEFGDLSNTILELFTKANYDALTGIYNRRFLETNLQNLMLLLSRSGGKLSVLMIDVDFFKLYNDTYGHQEGDHCLIAVAQALKDSTTRTSDFAARYGGEEFVVVLPNTDEVGAQLIASKVLENVRALNIPHAKNAAAECVTVSVGVTSGKVSHSLGWADYIKLADDALYISKQSGRNRFTFQSFPEEESTEKKSAFLV